MSQLPDGYRFAGSGTESQVSEDCMGRSMTYPGCLTVECPDGRKLFAYGFTAPERVSRGIVLAVQDAEYQALSPRQKLSRLAGMCQAQKHAFPHQLVEVITLLDQILLAEKSP